MKKNIIRNTLIATIAIVAGFNVYQSNAQISQLFNTTLKNIEALAGCESKDGYDLSKYCNPGTGRCYRGDFVASDCTSNYV